MYVKPFSMWFLSDDALSTWQKDEAHLSPEALKIHQDDVLQSREAWQFGNQQQVKVLKVYTVRPDEHQAEVEMLGPGRFHGFSWCVDTKDLTLNKAVEDAP